MNVFYKKSSGVGGAKAGCKRHGMEIWLFWLGIIDENNPLTFMLYLWYNYR